MKVKYTLIYNTKKILQKLILYQDKTNDIKYFMRECLKGRVMFLKLLGVLFLVSVIYPNPCYAYLDPGTGSMIIQSIIAAFVGVGCTFGILKEKIIRLVKSKKENK